MSYGNPVTNVTPNSGDLPFNGAFNGLSIDSVTGKVVLGQTPAGLTGDAALTGSRNVPVGASIITFTTTRTSPVGGGIRLLSALSGTGMNSVHFEALNVNQTGAITNGNTLTTVGVTPAWRISAGDNTVLRGIHVQPDYRPTGGTQILRTFSAQPNVVSTSGNGPYESIGYYCENLVVNNNAVDMTLRGFYYRISTAYSGSGTPTEIAFENTQGDNYFNSDSLGFLTPGRSFFGIAPGDEYSSDDSYILNVGNGLSTGKAYFLSNSTICATFKSGIGQNNNAMHIGFEGVDVSGASLVFFANNGTTECMRIAQSGTVRIVGSLLTGVPSGGVTVTAPTWRLGTVVAAAVALDTANYVEVSIGGVLRKLALVT